MPDNRSGADTFGRRFEGAAGNPDARPEPVCPPPRVRAVLDESRLDAPPGWLADSFVAGLLYLLAILAAAAGIFGGLFWLSRAAVAGVKLGDWIVVAGWMVGGIALAGVLFGVAGMVTTHSRQRRQLRGLEQAMRDLMARLEHMEATLPRQELLDPIRERLDQFAASLAEVAHNSLLDDAGRADRRVQLSIRQREQAVEQIRRELADGAWDRAGVAIERLRASFPRDSELANRLAEELERRRSQAEQEDVAAARAQCDELMSVSAWDKALSVAEQLVRKHPESAAAKGMLARMDRERKLARDQQRHGLYSQIQRHTSRREWRDAAQVAVQLIGLFPDSIEAEAVKAQMDTLNTNAEIQYRQNVEKTIKDLVRRQRFDEAVGLADRLIADYPNSPQATALREQLPRLKERAEHAAREARKRRVQWQ